MRAVLLAMEEIPYRYTLELSELKKELHSFSSDDVEYSVLKMSEANLIKITKIDGDNFYFIKSVDEITFYGHDFLESIRDNHVWSQTKNICGKVGSFALNVISQVSTNIITNLIQQHF